MEPTELRPATPDDAPSVAEIWHAGWTEAHLGRVPESLVHARTAESFSRRAADRVGDTVVATRDDVVCGFAMTFHDEVDQVYVAPSGRGSGAATALLGEAERRFRDAGHASAWLAVVGGNARARAFYERQGWVDEGPFTHDAPGPEGPIPVTAHRYVKTLS